MVIVDQFETQPCFTYTGSYSDNVVTPNVQTSTQVLPGARIASRVGGLTNKIQEVNLAYSTRLAFISGTAVGSPCKVRVWQGLSEDEFFFDSFVPSPASIANVDNIISPFLSFSLSVANQPNESALVASTDLNRPAQSERAAHVFFPGEAPGLEFGQYPGPSDQLKIQQFINFDWMRAPYPYQSKYRQLLRVLRPESRYPEPILVNKDPEGNTIDEPFFTTEIGSLFVTLGKGMPLINLSEWSQIWQITGSTTPTTSTELKHTFAKSYNHLNNIFWDNIPDTSNTPNNYVAVGEFGTILKSQDGLSWQLVASDRFLGPEHLKLQVAGYAADADIFDCEATGVSGQFRRWILGGDFGIIRQSTPSKEPEQTGWTWVDIPTLVGAASVAINGITTNDDDGSAGLGGASVCAVGQSTTPTAGVIITANQDGSTWTVAGGTATSGRPWYDVVYAAGSVNRFFAVGWDGGSGIVARSPSSTGTGTWTDITPGGSVFRLRGVDWNPDSDTLIAVGLGGQIWRSPNPGAGSPAWAQQTAAGGFTGVWRSVKYVHFSGVANGYWVAVGDGGEIQYSANDGFTWQQMNIELPARTLGTFSSPRGLFMGRPNFSSLQEAPRSMTVGGAVQDALDIQGNFSVVFMRVGEADFDSFTDTTNNAVFNQKRSFLSGALLVKPFIGDVFKTFFGFGDGLSLVLTGSRYGLPLEVGKSIQMVDFEDHSYYDLYRRDGNFGIGQFRLHGPKIRGWRYGIYNGLPTKSKCVFRSGRFGQFRDMLEQRSYSRFFLNRGTAAGTTNPAVSVTFISGTEVARSASIYATTATSTSFNPEDSGIWDYSYRSGRPFNDNL